MKEIAGGVCKNFDPLQQSFTPVNTKTVYW